MTKNSYKKQDALGNQLPEEIGKGINEEHLQKVINARKNDDLYRSRLPSELKESFNGCCKNPSEVLRGLMRQYVRYSKDEKLNISKTTNP